MGRVPFFLALTSVRAPRTGALLRLRPAQQRGPGLLFRVHLCRGSPAESQWWAPLLLSSALLGIGSLAMMQLPDTVGQPLEDMLAHHSGGGGLEGVCLGLRAKGGHRTHENGVGGDGNNVELTGLLIPTTE